MIEVMAFRGRVNTHDDGELGLRAVRLLCRHTRIRGVRQAVREVDSLDIERLAPVQPQPWRRFRRPGTATEGFPCRSGSNGECVRSFRRTLRARPAAWGLSPPSRAREPLPYILPAKTTRGTCASWHASAASKMEVRLPSSGLRVQPPFRPSASLFSSFTLAKVPRAMTSWLPRREPYVLKSAGSTPRSSR